MNFVKSAEMKIGLTPEQSEMLSTKENIKLIIRENPDTVMAFDIMEENNLYIPVTNPADNRSLNGDVPVPG